MYIQRIELFWDFFGNCKKKTLWNAKEHQESLGKIMLNSNKVFIRTDAN